MLPCGPLTIDEYRLQNICNLNVPVTNVFISYTFTFRKFFFTKMGTNGRNIQVQMYSNISIYIMPMFL